MRLALDTNAYSALMRGHRDVAALVRRAQAVLVPSVVAGELLYGFRLGSRFEENAARLEAFLEAPLVGLSLMKASPSQLWCTVGLSAALCLAAGVRHRVAVARGTEEPEPDPEAAAEADKERLMKIEKRVSGKKTL